MSVLLLMREEELPSIFSLIQLSSTGGDFVSLGDVLVCHDLGELLVSTGQSLEMLLNVLQCTGQQRIGWPQRSIALTLRKCINPRVAFGEYKNENGAALAKILLIYCELLFSISKILPLKIGKVRTLLPMTRC